MVSTNELIIFPSGNYCKLFFYRGASAAGHEPSAAVLEPPPAEVRIDHADLPATGAETFDSRVIELIENKLVEWQHQRNSPFDEIIKEWFKDNVDVENIVLAQISELGRSIDKKIERAINDYDYGDVVSEIVRNMSFSIDVE